MSSQQYKTVSYYTLGCKLNFAETSTIARQMSEAGFAKIPFGEGSDVTVINTCSVTENADKKCRQLVKKAVKANPNSFVAIIGCFAQLKPTEIAEISGVDIVLGANEKFNIVEHLTDLDKKDVTIIENEHIKETKSFVPSYSFGDRTRSFLKVQDGCDYFCSFCTIPLARGRSRSASIKETLKQAKEVAETQVKEVVLTGVNIGDFGAGNNESFLELIQELDQIKGIDRFRISSIEPNLLSDEIIAFVANSERFVPHFHIPLQSGNNEMLKEMRRRYDRELYANRVAHIKKVMPNACIGVDVITGFPGETDEHFLDSLNFIKSLDVSYLHAFTYSERANTTALRKDEIIPVNIRRDRSRQLQQLSHKLRRAFYESQLGNELTVLFEEEDHEGLIHGFTENYVKVAFPFNNELKNTLRKVCLDQIDINGFVRTKEENLLFSAKA